jgi:hypothetical protein
MIRENVDGDSMWAILLACVPVDTYEGDRYHKDPLNSAFRSGRGALLHKGIILKVIKLQIVKDVIYRQISVVFFKEISEICPSYSGLNEKRKAIIVFPCQKCDIVCFFITICRCDYYYYWMYFPLFYLL